MTLRFDSFFILSLVNDWMSILFPLPFIEVKPSDFSLDTSTDNETKRTFLAIAKMTYISVSVWRDQQYTHYIFLDAMIA